MVFRWTRSITHVHLAQAHCCSNSPCWVPCLTRASTNRWRGIRCIRYSSDVIMRLVSWVMSCIYIRVSGSVLWVVSVLVLTRSMSIYSRSFYFSIFSSLYSILLFCIVWIVEFYCVWWRARLWDVRKGEGIGWGVFEARVIFWLFWYTI